MRKLTKLLLKVLGPVCLVLPATLLYAQDALKVKGKVIAAVERIALPGATIRSEKGNQNTVSDAEGNFEVQVTRGSRITITMVGYQPLTITVSSSEVLAELKTSTSNMDEVVVVGYGNQSKAKMTSAVSSINSDDVQMIPTSNLSNVLAGRLSGTFVSSQTGTPGAGSNIKIRAASSFSGNTVPVFVIDGVVRDKTSFDALDPNEVSDITILKDAASAAIYGSRSSNGVVLVKTKTGKSGRPVFQFTTTFNTQRTGKLPEYMPLKDGLELSRSVNGGMSDEEIDWVLKTNPKGENYYDAAYTNPNSQRHVLGLSGGNDKITYYMGGSYFNENGFLPNVWYKKYNLRGNIQATPVKNLTLGLNLSSSFGTFNRFNFTYDYGSSDLNNLWGKLLYWDVFAPPYINGKPVDPGWLGNPVEMMRNGGYYRNRNQLMDGLVTVEYKVPFVEGLSVKAAYSRNFANNYIKTFAKKQPLYQFKKAGANSLIYTDTIIGTIKSGDPGTEYLGNEYGRTDNYQLNTQLNYTRSFGKHSVDVLAAYEQFEGAYNYTSMYRYNFPLFPTDQFFAASANNADWSTGGNESQDGRLSYIGRLSYDYDGKYLLTASVRRDGSVKFAPDKRWGWFPSVSVGWVLSKEPFFRKTAIASSLNFLKIRGSFATTGNDAIGGWQWLDQYNIQSSTYYLGNPGVAAPRLNYGGIPNTALTWEASNSIDLGLELTAFNHVRLVADYWKRHTYDILGSRILAIPAEFGGALPAENYGAMNSNGFELELGYENTIGNDFHYEVKGIFSYATNKVIKKDVAANARPFENPNGKTSAYGFGYQAQGIIRTQEDLDKLPAGFTINGVKPALGDMLMADLSGPEGKPDNMVDGYDQVVLGDYFGANNAPVTFGLNLSLSYKGFGIETLLSGLSGFKVSYNDAWGRNFGGGGKVPVYHADSWTADNPDGTTPKIYPWGDAHSYGYTWTSTFNVYKGDFLRMKYLNLNYQLPAAVIRKINAKDLRVFAAATNLFYISKFKYYDPELYQFMSYPTMKTFSIGLDLKF
ncbi:SusC/RagA family TonB-linked outer membrane protein [Chitinophaga sp. GCM10012297]|uniref:SusC/RagA family TonB-linked outer membrane protein n=1 Tax=Chitinophaga chungangae TaxID=2821488 RepID=A0ABS3YC54_9BACT|nr:SusC/RagA family TonB-linked outer membrane protein [Chitinophaga chungangae]MBO9152267.1 SusC/RagA family TonB-linked outer membrane protein [Chitinophaga chungangae]